MLLDYTPPVASPEVAKNRGLTFFQSLLLAFALFVGVGLFSFEEVANWLGIICFLVGAAFTLKLVSDQERRLPLWILPSIILGPVAAIVLLALPPQGEAFRTRFSQLQRSAIALSSLPLAFIFVLILTAATGQGSFKVLKASDVPLGFTPGISEGENLCGKTINLEGTVTDASRATDAQMDFVLSDGTEKTPPIFANKQLGPLQNGERVREQVLVNCNDRVGNMRIYVLVELSRRGVR